MERGTKRLGFYSRGMRDPQQDENTKKCTKVVKRPHKNTF
jgi:hypothetical protein